MPQPRVVVAVGMLFLLLVTSFGLASAIDSSNVDDNTKPVVTNPVASAAADQVIDPIITTLGEPGSGIDALLSDLPAGTPTGSLNDERLELADGAISTLVTTDGSGKYEYGIMVEGAAADAVDDGELVLTTASGLTFTPELLSREGGKVSTTINAYHDAEAYVVLRWIDNGTVRAVIYQQN